MDKQVLVVAAHTDDEALGCGGTIAKHVKNGDTVFAVFIADGVSSRPDAEEDEPARRNLAATNAQRILGIAESFMLGLPDNRLDSLPLLDIVQPLESVVSKIKPDIVYTHHYGDLNVDHQIVHKAVMTACRPLPASSVKEIYAFEVLSSTEWNTPGHLTFQPNHFVDITDTIDTKLASLDAYKLEMRASPHSRSIEHARTLAQSRGLTVGTYFAEAFMTVRVIK